MTRRWREIAEIHLARCRRIEFELGLEQHTLVKKGNKPSGVTINEGVRKRWIRVPFPSGWGTIVGLIFAVTILVWTIAAYFAIP